MFPIILWCYQLAHTHFNEIITRHTHTDRGLARAQLDRDFEGAEKTGSIFHLLNRTLEIPIDLTRFRELIGRLQGEPTTPSLFPLGVQEVTRQFHCRGCYSAICDLPLDCPGERAGKAGML